MNKPVIVANWKSFKAPDEAKSWFEELIVASKIMDINFKEEIILCAPYIDLPLLNESLKFANGGLKFVLGAQNISPDEKKPLTGEITPDMINNLVVFTMVGHSERRQNLGETDEMVNKKIGLAQFHGIRTITCVSSLDQVKSIASQFPEYVDLILYEPISAIGSGKTENPSEANEFIKEIKKILPGAKVLYGGSVKGDNVKEIIQQEFIDGVAVGGASLVPSSFLDIIKNVA